MTAWLWLDVEDLFEYARGNSRPSGIQRLAFEIYAALRALPDCADIVHFVRHDYARDSFRTVPWQEIEGLFASLTSSAPEPAPLTSPIAAQGALRRIARRLLYRLAPTPRFLVIDAFVTQKRALEAWRALFAALFRRLVTRMVTPLKPLRGPRRSGAGASAGSTGTGDDFASRSKPGDFIVVLGSPWSHPEYAALILAQRRRGLRFGLLVYDLIPLRRPEWCNQGLVRLFRDWFAAVLPLCDAVFAISRATAADVEAYARERGLRLNSPVAPIPIGTGFGARDFPVRPRYPRPLPPAGAYALIVSTIEARKNHLLLFRVWRRLLEEMPRDATPTLVFAGRIGWLVDDLMRQIANTCNLNGKLVIIENPTDAELCALYGGCLFTLFPSFSEGWGLPVTESLSFGKPCFTSDRTSLPEAGGDLTRRFDPDNLNDAYAMIREAIEDRPGLARWEARIRREFKPTPWSETAEALLSGLGVKKAAIIDPEQAGREAIPHEEDRPMRLDATRRS